MVWKMQKERTAPATPQRLTSVPLAVPLGPLLLSTVTCLPGPAHLGFTLKALPKANSSFWGTVKGWVTQGERGWGLW